MVHPTPPRPPPPFPACQPLQVQRMELQRLLEGHDGCVNTVAFDESGSVLVSGSDDQTIRVWDWERGEAPAARPAPGPPHLEAFQARLPGRLR